MPELPEVETVRRILIKNLIGKRITNVNVYYDGVLENVKIQKVDDNSFKEHGFDETVIALFNQANDTIIIRKNDANIIDSVYHELTHAIMKALNLGGYGCDAYVQKMLDDCSDEELRTIYTEFMRYNLLTYKISLRELYSITPDVRQRMIRQLLPLFYL